MARLLIFLFSFTFCLWEQTGIRVDAGWVIVQQNEQGWEVVNLVGLITPNKESKQTVPTTRRCNLQKGDLLLSVDGLDLSSLGPLGIAGLLSDLPFRKARMEVLRHGDRWVIKPFADQYAGTEKPPPSDQLQKRKTPAPDFSLPDLDGKLHNLSSLRGRWVLLNFWGTWCPSCIDELPALKELGSHYRSKLDVIGIALNDSPETLRRFLSNEKLPYPVLVGGTFDDRTARAYNLDRAPTNVVIDPEGQVRFVGVSLKAAVEAVSSGLQQR